MERTKISRRKALTKLGLAAGTIYTAPTVLRIDRSARAQGASNGQGNGGCPPGQARKGLC